MLPMRPRISRRRLRPSSPLPMLPFSLTWIDKETGQRFRVLYISRLDAKRARDALLATGRP